MIFRGWNTDLGQQSTVLFFVDEIMSNVRR